MTESFLSKIQYCPNCGVQYSLQDKDPTGSFKCTNCNFKNYIKSFPTVSAIIPNISNKEEILMVRRAFDPGKGKLDPPGGFINYNETPENAVKREIKEELGLDLTVSRILHVGAATYAQNDIVYPVIGTSYLMSATSLDNLKVDKSENSEAVFVNVKDVLNGKVEIIWEPVLVAIKEYAESINL